MPTVKERLKGMQESYDAGKKKAQGIPDGKYKFQLQNAEITEVKDTQLLQVHWESLILEGEFAGECKHDWNRMDGDWGTVFMLQRIEQLGFEIPERNEDLEETISVIAEAAPTFNGTLRTTKNKKTGASYQNLTVDRLLPSETAPRRESTKSTPAPPADEDSWKIGDRIVVEIDGVEEKGKITKLNDEDAEIEYDDETTGTAPYDDLVLDEGSAPASEDGDESWKVEDRCIVDIEGEGKCSGVIENIDGDVYSVKFTDDTEGDFGVDDLEPEEAEEESPTFDELSGIATSIEGFDVTDADTRASLIEKLTEGEWDRTEFLPDEIEMLEAIGAKFSAVKPKKAAKKKASKKKSTKKSTKKKAAKKKASPKKKATKKKKR